MSSKAESELLLALAPQLEDFIVELFGIRHEARTLAKQHQKLAPRAGVHEPVRAEQRIEEVVGEGTRRPLAIVRLEGEGLRKGVEADDSR